MEIINNANKSNKSKEEFITDKINEKRNSALNKSRIVTQLQSPKIPLTEEEINSIISEIKLNENKINIYDKKQHNLPLSLPESIQANLIGDINELYKKNEKLKKLLNDKCKDGYNCLYNSSGYYGKKYRKTSNQLYLHDHPGFKIIPNEEMQPGDQIQSLRNENGKWVPHHMSILNRIDNNGKLRLNYSRGNSDPSSIVVDGRFPSDSILTYRFVGTPQDSLKWENEYKQKFQIGGKVKTNVILNQILKCAEGDKIPIIGQPINAKKVISKVNKSHAPFVERLKVPYYLRQVLPLQDGSVGTHKMSWANKEKDAIVYPEIQSTENGLKDFSDNRQYAFKRAMQTGDYIILPNDEAKWFTENYKNYYDGFNTEIPNSNPTWPDITMKKMQGPYKFEEPTLSFANIKTTAKRPYNEDYIKYINQKLIDKGYDINQRSTILANIIEESGGNPFSIDETGEFKGLLQWSPERFTLNKNMDTYDAIDQQIDYLHNTLHNLHDTASWSHGGTGSKFNHNYDAYNTFNSNNDLAWKNRAMVYGYVRPTDLKNANKNRLNVAQQIKTILQNYENEKQRYIDMKNNIPLSNFNYEN